MRIRAIDVKDSSQLEYLDHICFPPSIAYSEREFSHLLASKSTFGTLVEGNDKVIGFILVAWEHESAEIITIDVDPDYRRQGIGTRLISLMEEYLRENGVQCLFLHVNVENRPAQTFYTSKFFFKISKKERYYNDGCDAFVMVKFLNKPS